MNKQDGIKKHANKNPDRVISYFRDNQITILVKHSSDGISESQLSQLKEKLSTTAGEAIQKDVIAFPALKELGDRGFSILNYSLANGPDDPAELLNNIRSVRKSFVSGEEIIEGLTFISASPNWLTSSSSQGGGTGGPGGKPSAYKNGNLSANKTERKDAPYRFAALIAGLQKYNLYGDGKNVDVAILDTAPCPHELVLAPKEYPEHPIIRTLLGTNGVPGGKLRLYPATYAELIRMGNTSINKHDYSMTDHGLFAAGIIHSIAPEATIHLIEVLNPFGVGDLVSMANGLRKVYTEIYNPERRLVVNCSWMLEFPYHEGHLYQNHPPFPSGKEPSAEEIEFERAVLAFVQEDREQASMIKEFCVQLAKTGRQIVAAAGNDWMPGQGKVEPSRSDAPPARYPAAFDEAIGVGALPKDLQKEKISGRYKGSSYSNLGDEPPRNGILTLGGEEGDEQGVLGLYLGDFPSGGRNDNKWAWWAGTSFATPILTGVLASVLSSPENISRTQDALQRLYSASLIKNNSSGASEDVMEATQTL